MKKTLLLLSAVILLFAGCKKDDIIEASKVEIKNESIERGWDYIKISGEYDYPVVLESMTLFLSEKEDMSGARSYDCVLKGKVFSVEASDLNDGKKYFYCYEYDNGYTKEKSGKDNTSTFAKPVVVTEDATNVTISSAMLKGSITNNDAINKITARGFCWSTSQNPDIDDEVINNGSSSGTGISTFTHKLENLTENTTYYYRTYAITNYGTIYGDVKSFKTVAVFDETIDSNGNRIITLNGVVVFTMIAVEGGTFQMGATSEQGSDAYSNESPVHSVTLSDYYIGETEVTQELWESVMGSNPSGFSGYPQRPVEQVSWNDCQEFITKLNELTGKNFRLPTEAEWEYAARGGNKTKGYKYSGSNSIGNVAWYTDNSSSRTHDVKTKQANELGIYDMSGNVWEWCQDWKGDYSSSSQTNPTGPSSGSYRVLRGGSWNYGARYCRVSSRDSSYPDYRSYDSGFRLVLQELQ